jgi:hypothetical protein
VRSLVAADVAPAAVVSADGDVDRLLTRPDCRIVKMQRKVIVGRVTTAVGTLYVKRYNVFAWRVALASLWRESPAVSAWHAARILAERGFNTPEPVAAVELRRAGLLRRSFFLTREVPEALTADRRWQVILAEANGTRRRTERWAFARALGELFRRLHAAGLYHNDLKDVNVLVRGPAEAPVCVLLDLERVRVLRRVDHRRRIKNLVQLARTLGRETQATDRARFLRAYLGPDEPRAGRRRWVQDVQRQTSRKDRGRRVDTPPVLPPRLTCTLVCQNEEPTIAACLESVAWCDEIVVVDGGSTDRTVDIARRFTKRVLVNPWPGYRAQKQFALEAATGDWVLNVDADERITPELATEIRARLADVPTDVAGFTIPRLVSYLDRWWYRGGWYPRPIVRLMRRSATIWGGTDPHERAIVAGRVMAMRAAILHYTYEDIADHVRSANTLTTVAAGQSQRGRRVGVGRLVGEPAWRFLRSYILKRGVLEGLPGLFVAATDAFYVYLRWAKVRERQSTARARYQVP